MLANERHPEDRRVRKRLGSHSAGAAEFAILRAYRGILRVSRQIHRFKGQLRVRSDPLFQFFDVPEPLPDPARRVGRTGVEKGTPEVLRRVARRD